MQHEAALQVGFLCYPRLTQLDMTGPYEVLVRMPYTKVHVLWKDRIPVSTEDGLQIVANCSLADAPKLDVIVVPGGLGQQDLMEDQQVLGFLRTQAESARYVVSVCTGSLLLGAAGLLTGYRATCHWMYLHLLELLGAIPTAERVVVDRNRITGAGVSAGIDCALQLVALLRGQEAAQAIQLQIEYDPRPPFDCGSPRKAPDWLVSRLKESARSSITARREVVNRIAVGHSG
jgi:cyclohexyl-isocyanide hydratase